MFSQLYPSIYYKRDDFNFDITNCPFLSSNVPSTPFYGVFISQLKGYTRACSSYECFIPRARQILNELIKQIYPLEIVIQEVVLSIRGSYSAIWNLPLKNVTLHSDLWPTTVTFQPIKLSTNFTTLIPSLTFTELQVVSSEHLQRVWLSSRERLPFRTPRSVPLAVTWLCSSCWDKFYRTSSICSRLFTLNTFSILLYALLNYMDYSCVSKFC